jgi:hypothetical protein
VASVPRKVSVNSEQNFARDDENDTLLFERWEAYVIEKYPNPERTGCPSHEVLESFVDKPAAVSLADLKDSHITRCRECTLELRELRRLREERLKKAASPRSLQFWVGWPGAAAAAAVCCITLILALTIWQHHRSISRPVPLSAEVVELTIDLSGDGVTRSPGAESEAPLFSLPRKIVDLDLRLPYFSPSGEYVITIARDKNDGVLRSAQAEAVADGPHTQARLRLDLRNFSPGRYYLGATKAGESTTSFYPFTLN